MFNLKEVIISITNRCNSRCVMCDIPKDKIDELSSLEWETVIKDASSSGASTVVFSGGEPLLREDIFRLISFAKRNNMGACITSNGLLINDDTASKLSSVGVNVVNISIEGPPDVHNYLRGEGTFDKATSALANLKKYNVESTIATVVTSYNYRHLSYIVKLAADYGVTTIKFQPFNAIFIKDESKENIFLISKEEVASLSSIINEVILLCDEYGISTNPASYLERIPLYLSKSSFDHNGFCSALWCHCSINSRGDVYPCWVMIKKDVLIGNVKEKRFLEIWDSRRHNLIRDKIKSGGCSGCMMSCYDEAFGKDNIQRKIAVSVKRFKKNSFRKYLKNILIRSLKRIRFYHSYRGSLSMFLKRLGKMFRKKEFPKKELNKEGIKKALEEVYAIRNMFEEESSL